MCVCVCCFLVLLFLLFFQTVSILQVPNFLVITGWSAATQVVFWYIADSCANSYRELLLGQSANPQLLVCPRRPGIVGRDKKRVARFLRLVAMQDGDVTSEDEAAVAQRLLDTVMLSIVSSGCVVSDGCTVCSGCVISSCIMIRGCTVGSGCVVSDGCTVCSGCVVISSCIMIRGCTVGSGCVVSDGCTVCSGCVISSCIMIRGCTVGSSCVVSSSCQ